MVKPHLGWCFVAFAIGLLVGLGGSLSVKIEKDCGGPDTVAIDGKAYRVVPVERTP